MNLGANAVVGGFQNCLQFSGSAVLNPVDYVNGLAKAFVAKGGQIFERTRVKKPDNNKVTTMAGNQVSIPLILMASFIYLFGQDEVDSYTCIHVSMATCTAEHINISYSSFSFKLV